MAALGWPPFRIAAAFLPAGAITRRAVCRPDMGLPVESCMTRRELPFPQRAISEDAGSEI